MLTRADVLSPRHDGGRSKAARGSERTGVRGEWNRVCLPSRQNPGGLPMRSWIAAGTLALVLAVGLAIPAEAGGHRHSRYNRHGYSYSYGYSDPYADGYSDRYRYPVYDYGYDYGYRYGYNNYVPYGYYSPYRYGAPYVLYAPPPPAYGYYYAPNRRHVRPHLSVTLGLW